MTDGQFNNWHTLAMKCDMPRTAHDAKTLADARAAFPEMFAALMREQEKRAAAEARLSAFVAGRKP